MEQTCQKCGATVNAEQAFCSKCGAVVGMGDDAARRGGDEWDMASTFVSKKSGTAPLPQRPPATAERELPAALDAPIAAHTDAPAATPARGGNNTMLYAVVGFVVVLLVGGLLILLFYMNSRG
jgi:hypothetical protein